MLLDIKLANIFVERDNTGSNEINTVLGDFGLSMITDSGLKEYQSQMATFNFENPAGSSPFYAPPEYHMAFKKKNFQYLDPHKPMSGDIYSLGIVLSCCILRKTPQRLNFGADIKNR